MRRPRVLVGVGSQREAPDRLRALQRTCETRVVYAGAPDRAFPDEAAVSLFLGGLAMMASKTEAEALVLIDGPLTRMALRRGRLARLPTALWTERGDGAPIALPGSSRGEPPWPDEVWWSGPRRPGERLEFIPGAVRELSVPDAARRAADWARGSDFAMKRGLTTIVMPCWNGLKDTKAAVAAVLAHTDAPFELVIVDNGSKDGTARWARSLRDRRVKVVANAENLGFAKAMNQGLRLARGPYAVWLNNDCVVTPGWLRLMQDALERAPWIAAVGPMTDGARGLQRAAGAPPSPRGLRRYAQAWSLRHDRRSRWVHRLVGFCLLHRTELLVKAGYLDERFGLGCYEDFDWCLRARQAGYELYVAEDVFVAHRGQASFKGNSVDHVEVVRRNRDVFVDKWCRRGLAFLDELDGPLER